MRRHANLASTTYTCASPECNYPAESGRDYCCNACKHQEGHHTRNCTSNAGRLGAVEPDRSPVCFWPWNHHIRENDCSVIRYIEWFNPCLSGELLFEWEMTEWVIRRAERTRKLELHAYSYQDCPRGGRVFDCGSCDARSDAYVMEDVSGLDFEVVAVLVAQVAVPRLLRDAIIEIEASNARSACFSCRGGTHRSVGLCYLAQLVVYPEASFHPHTRRMTEAATRNLLEGSR